MTPQEIMRMSTVIGDLAISLKCIADKKGINLLALTQSIITDKFNLTPFEDLAGALREVNTAFELHSGMGAENSNLAPIEKHVSTGPIAEFVQSYLLQAHEKKQVLVSDFCTKGFSVLDSMKKTASVTKSLKSELEELREKVEPLLKEPSYIDMRIVLIFLNRYLLVAEQSGLPEVNARKAFYEMKALFEQVQDVYREAKIELLEECGYFDAFLFLIEKERKNADKADAETAAKGRETA